MRKIFYLLTLVALAACSAGNTYEKTIADYVQTDKHGTKFDAKFKAIDIREIARYTVADSIALIKDAFEKDRMERIAGLDESKKNYTESATKEKNSRLPSKTMINFYDDLITKNQRTIDSLKTLSPAGIEKYENRKPDELLAIVVRCKYSVVPPIINTRAEETFDFTLSPDGLKCYGKKRAS